MSSRLAAWCRGLGTPWLVLGLFLIVTVSAFEITAVLTALPTIVKELEGDAYYGAAPAAYLVASLFSVVAAGEASDRAGPSLPLAVGTSVFVTGLFVSGTANSASIVVLGRLLQGLGAGCLATIAYIAVRRAVPESAQPKVYALLSAGWVVPSLAAPAVAGAITKAFGWRWVFLALIPLLIVVGVLLVWQLRALKAPGGERRPSRVPAALLLAVGGGLVVFASTRGELLLALVSGVVGLTLCWVAGRRLLPPGVLKCSPGLPSAIAARFCATAAFGGVDAFVPLAAERVHGVDNPVWQGSVIIGAALTWTIGQAVAARRAATMDTPRFVRSGFLLLALGVVTVASVAFTATPLILVFLAWSIGGLGMGMLFNPTTVVGMAASTDHDSGVASSQLTMTDNLGFAAAAALGGACVGIADRTDWPLRDALLVSFGTALAVALVGALVASRGVRINTRR